MPIPEREGSGVGAAGAQSGQVTERLNKRLVTFVRRNPHPAISAYIRPHAIPTVSKRMCDLHASQPQTRIPIQGLRDAAGNMNRRGTLHGREARSEGNITFITTFQAPFKLPAFRSSANIYARI